VIVASPWPEHTISPCVHVVGHVLAASVIDVSVVVPAIGVTIAAPYATCFVPSIAATTIVVG
jgi:hypothetical protein